MLYITEMMIDKLSPHNLKFRATASTDGVGILFNCQMTSQPIFICILFQLVTPGISSTWQLLYFEMKAASFYKRYIYLSMTVTCTVFSGKNPMPLIKLAKFSLYTLF